MMSTLFIKILVIYVIPQQNLEVMWAIPIRCSILLLVQMQWSPCETTLLRLPGAPELTDCIHNVLDSATIEVPMTSSCVWTHVELDLPILHIYE